MKANKRKITRKSKTGRLATVTPDKDDPARPAPQSSHSGTLSSQDDTGTGSVVEPGLPITPEEMGRQFLSGATEQDNFESELRSKEVDPGAAPLGVLISESTLASAGQRDRDVPESTALSGAPSELEIEAPFSEIDVSTGVMKGGSLLDQPIETFEEEDVRAPAELRVDDLERFRSGSGVDEEERRKEMDRTKRRLREGRGGLPKTKPSRAVRSATDVRRAAHRVRSSHRAAEIVRDATGLDDAESAMAALEIVCAGIVRRIQRTEAGDFIAQLPSEIREHMVTEVPSGPERGLTRETIESEIARRFDVEMNEASALVGRVGTAIEHLVSEGEVAHVRAQLPEDLRSIFSGDVLHRTP